MAKKDKFIHISHLAGPLPFFTYGPYWGYHYHDSISNHKKGTSSIAQRNDGLEFGEIGMLSSESLSYRKAVAMYRKGMEEEFGWLYDKVKQSLSSLLSNGEKPGEERPSDQHNFVERKMILTRSEATVDIVRRFAPHCVLLSTNGIATFRFISLSFFLMFAQSNSWETHSDCPAFTLFRVT